VASSTNTSSVQGGARSGRVRQRGVISGVVPGHRIGRLRV
jgi:hypothetical protein